MVLRAVCSNPRCGHAMSQHGSPFDDSMECGELGCRCVGGYAPAPERKDEPMADRIYRFVEHLETMTKVIVCNMQDEPRISAAISRVPAPGLFKIVVSDSIRSGTLVVIDKALNVADWSGDLSDDQPGA
jgi:hypothetical protein